MMRERPFLANKVLENVAPTRRTTSPASSSLLEPEISGVSFLGTIEIIETYVTNTKRPDMFVECPRGGRRPTFIFITIVIVHRVPTNG